jgi:hypothetical protein
VGFVVCLCAKNSYSSLLGMIMLAMMPCQIIPFPRSVFKSLYSLTYNRTEGSSFPQVNYPAACGGVVYYLPYEGGIAPRT